MVFIFTACALNTTMAQVKFHRDFAPSEGIVKPQESPFREVICINGYWDFQPVEIPSTWISGKGIPPNLALPKPEKWESVPIKIPSAWNVNAVLHDESGQGMDSRSFPSYPDSWNHVKMGWLHKKVMISQSWKGKEVFIHLKAVAGDCRILVNNKEITLHFDNALPGEYNITSAINWGEENEILLGVRDPKLYSEKGKYGSYTYPTGSFWLENAIGVWQDVFLLAKPQIHISDVFFQPKLDNDLLVAEVTLENNTNKRRKIDVQIPVYEWLNKTDLSEQNMLKAPEISWELGKEVLQLSSTSIVLEAGQKTTTSLKTEVKGRLKKWELWTRGVPNLYAGIAQISTRKKVVDKSYQRFGWRDVKIKDGDFLLNGKRVELRYEGWHFTGTANMTRRYAWAWYTVSKAAHINFVRPHAMPYPDYFYDMADEMGMLMMDETGIFGSHVNFNYESPEFWERNQKHIENLVKRDRNHPSIIGWSVANEVRCVLIWQAKNNPDFQQEVYNKIFDLEKIARKLDPTRAWVQSDGDKDLDGRQEVYTIHTGEYLTEKVPENKLWGVTEGGSSYYGKPGYYEKYIGDRAYGSFNDRMDALAIEDYKLIKTLRDMDADISNAWNLVWHGLKPISMGLQDVSQKELKLTDGVFFDAYIEGKPGVQPERIAPFSTTLNPGYDLNLPLYNPYPLFLAMQAANHPDKPQACEWDDLDIPVAEGNTAVIVKNISKVGFLGNKDGMHYNNLKSIGVSFSNDFKNSKCIIIDMASIEPVHVDAIKKEANKIVENAGTVLLVGLTDKNLALTNKILPTSINCTPDGASSLLTNINDNRTVSISLKDVYFAENPINKIISKYSLAGNFVEKGNSLLYRNNTDWRRWLNGGEYSKTISIYRSELENKKNPVFIEYVEGEGRYFASTIELEKISDYHVKFYQQLFENLGFHLSKSKKLSFDAFEGNTLVRALSIGRFGAASIKEGMNTDYINELKIQPKEKDVTAENVWKMIVNNGDRFLLKDHNQSGPQDIYANYFSYWIFSPIDLSDLLNSGPDMPQVNKQLIISDAGKLFLNGQFIEPTNSELIDYRLKQNYRSIPLKQGWNHFLIKVVTDNFDVPNQGTLFTRIDSNNKFFEKELKTAIEVKF